MVKTWSKKKDAKESKRRREGYRSKSDDGDDALLNDTLSVVYEIF